MKRRKEAEGVMTQQRATRHSVTVLVAVALVAALMFGVEAPSGAEPAALAAVTSKTVSGMVQCSHGRAVLGVGVVWSYGNKKGNTPWTRSTLPGYKDRALYSKPIPVASGTGTSIRVMVKCARSAKYPNLALYSLSTVRKIHGDYWFNMGCSGNKPYGRCNGFSKGRIVDPYSFPGGWCTTGAAALWKKATGTYPSLGWGDAHQWNQKAKQQGWTVMGIPRVRSIAVWELAAYSGGGHVGWVTRVWLSGNKIRFHVREMNFGTKGQWNDRDITFGEGTWGKNVSFIMAPDGPAVTS